MKNVYCVFKSNYHHPMELQAIFETKESAEIFISVSEKDWDYFIKEYVLGQPIIKPRTLNDLARGIK